MQIKIYCHSENKLTHYISMFNSSRRFYIRWYSEAEVQSDRFWAGNRQSRCTYERQRAHQTWHVSNSSVESGLSNLQKVGFSVNVQLKSVKNLNYFTNLALQKAVSKVVHIYLTKLLIIPTTDEIRRGWVYWN